MLKKTNNKKLKQKENYPEFIANNDGTILAMQKNQNFNEDHFGEDFTPEEWETLARMEEEWELSLIGMDTLLSDSYDKDIEILMQNNYN